MPIRTHFALPIKLKKDNCLLWFLSVLQVPKSCVQMLVTDIMSISIWYRSSPRLPSRLSWLFLSVKIITHSHHTHFFNQLQPPSQCQHLKENNKFYVFAPVMNHPHHPTNYYSFLNMKTFGRVCPKWDSCLYRAPLWSLYHLVISELK